MVIYQCRIQRLAWLELEDMDIYMKLVYLHFKITFHNGIITKKKRVCVCVRIKIGSEKCQKVVSAGFSFAIAYSLHLLRKPVCL